MRMKPKLLSISALAKHFGVDRTTVDRRLAHIEPVEKRISGSFSEHLYDLATVTKIFSKYRVKKAKSTALTDAKRSRLTSQVELLRDRVNAVRDKFFDAELIDKMTSAEVDHIKREVRAFVKAIKLPADMAGLSGREIYRTVDAAIRAGLTKLANSTRASMPDDDGEEEEADAIDIDVDLAKLDGDELLTLRHNLQSMAISLARLVKNGQAVSVETWSEKMNDRLVRTRSRLLAIAGRLGSLASSSVGDLQAEMNDLVEAALSELDRDPAPVPEDIDEVA